jgi:hypothetical protein
LGCDCRPETFFPCRFSHFRQKEAQVYRAERINNPAKRKGIPGMMGSTTPRTPMQMHTHPTIAPHSDPGLFRFVIQPGKSMLLRLRRALKR